MALAGSAPVRPGEVSVGPKEHSVGKGPPIRFFVLSVITQRQLEQGHQPESVQFEREKCGSALFRSTHDEPEIPPAGPVAVFPSTIYGGKAAARFNSEDALRHCAKCGHDNPLFPLPVWGWDRYTHNTGIAGKAWSAMPGHGE